MEKIHPKIAIAIFLKLPIPGKVKTRIAATVGDVRAAELYAEMVRLFWENALNPLDRQRFELVACCDPMGTKEEYKTAFPFLQTQWLRQQGRDLGERMANTFRTLNPPADATVPGYAATLLVGTDCITMRPYHFEEAAKALEEKPIVLGPATDGGYYLVGARECHSDLFRGISWSTDTVLAQTKEIAESLHLRVHQLEVLSDIDTWEDLERAGWSKPPPALP